MNRSFAVFVIALLTVSCLWPAEAAYEGAGLHWAAFTCMIGAGLSIATIRQIRHAEPDTATLRPAGTPASTFRWCMADTGWILVAAGHWVSTAMLFQRRGDLRSAINLSLEWLGLLVAWFLLRLMLSSTAGRHQLAGAMVVVSTGLAVCGIWQHHVVYKDQAAWYRSLRTELEDQSSRTDAASTLRATQILREMRGAEIPMEGTQRFLWEQRLLNSSEPVATFALANTLAGILAVSVVLICGSLLHFLQLHGPRQKIALMAIVTCFALLTYCLILTKSRTAWAGCGTGIVWLLISQRRRDNWVIAEQITKAGAAIAIVSLLIAISFGAIDREVVLESPRSLQFRLFYWIGTAGMLRESPVFGTGPGNFRQSYLTHKVPETSEEIRDPHNLVMESWTSGGLIALSGVLICGIALVLAMNAWRKESAAEVDGIDGKEVPHLKQRFPGSLTSGIVGGCFLHAAWQWLNGADPVNDSLPWIIIPAVALPLSTFRLERILSLSPTIAQAATLTLGIHLMGAGGFEIPTTMLFLAACLAACTGQYRNAELIPEREASGIMNKSATSISGGWIANEGRHRWKAITANSLIAIGCTVGVYLTTAFGMIPVMKVGNLTASGNHLQTQGDYRAAAAAFRAAAAADSYSVTPRQRLAELEAYRLAVTLNSSSKNLQSVDEMISAALAACDDWMQADPRNPAVYRLRASILISAGKLTDDETSSEQALASQNKVVRIYPSSAADWWRLAELQLEIIANTENPDPKLVATTVQTAEQALLLDGINRQWGHVDRFLTETQLATLKSVVEGNPDGLRIP